jgi:hypothetical protein
MAGLAGGVRIETGLSRKSFSLTIYQAVKISKVVNTNIPGNCSFPEELGFLDSASAHTGRTIMFKELSLLLEVTPHEISFDEIHRKVEQENILMKSSVSGREKSFYHLKLSYGLDVQVPVFRALRFLWDFDPRERRMLALQCALARDTILRASAPFILSLKVGEVAEKELLMDLVEKEYPHRYSPKTVRSISENLLSSWTQSGHLEDKNMKTRVKATAGPASVTYALFLGYLCGVRGKLLHNTVWTNVLDATDSEIQEYVYESVRKGWLIYKNAGGIVEVSFPPDFADGIRWL